MNSSTLNFIAEKLFCAKISAIEFCGEYFSTSLGMVQRWIFKDFE